MCEFLEVTTAKKGAFVFYDRSLSVVDLRFILTCIFWGAIGLNKCSFVRPSLRLSYGFGFIYFCVEYQQLFSECFCNTLVIYLKFDILMIFFFEISPTVNLFVDNQKNDFFVFYSFESSSSSRGVLLSLEFIAPELKHILFQISKKTSHM